MLHSSGCKLSHRPTFDQEKIEAMDFDAFSEFRGTALYGVLEADCDGVIVPFGKVYIDAGGETLGNCLVWPMGIKGMGTSSSSSPSDDSEVSDSSSSSESSSSLSLEDSVAVDGSYSCFRGEEERRRVL